MVSGESVIGVAIDKIDPDLRPASNMRVRLDKETIKEYAEAIDGMPPVRLAFDVDDGTYWVEDGAHRISGARQAGRNEIRAVIRTASYYEAWKQAAGANTKNGLRITNADKRHRVEVALADDEMKTWSNRRIAEWCGVHHDLVASIKPQLAESASSDPPKTTGRDGKARGKPKPRQPKEAATAADQPQDSHDDGTDDVGSQAPETPECNTASDGGYTCHGHGPSDQDFGQIMETTENFLAKQFGLIPEGLRVQWLEMLEGLVNRFYEESGWNTINTLEVGN